MSRRAWTLLAVLVVLGVAIGGYFWLSRPKPAAAASPGSPPSRRRQGKARHGSAFRKDGRHHDTREKGHRMDPGASGPEGVTLDPDAVDSLAGMFASLTAESLVDEKPTDLGQFGLQPPRAEGTGTFSDGSTHTLLLGDKTPGGGSYYMQVKGNPGVYTVFTANGERLHWTTNDLRSKAVTPALNYDEITYLKLVGHDGKVIEARDKTPVESKSFQLGNGPLRAHPGPTRTCTGWTRRDRISWSRRRRPSQFPPLSTTIPRVFRNTVLRSPGPS